VHEHIFQSHCDALGRVFLHAEILGYGVRFFKTDAVYLSAENIRILLYAFHCAVSPFFIYPDSRRRTEILAAEHHDISHAELCRKGGTYLLRLFRRNAGYLGKPLRIMLDNLKAVRAELRNYPSCRHLAYTAYGSRGEIFEYSRFGGRKLLLVKFHLELLAEGGMINPTAECRDSLTLREIRHIAYESENFIGGSEYFTYRISVFFVLIYYFFYRAFYGEKPLLIGNTVF